MTREQPPQAPSQADRLAGHLGHLTPEQEKLLEEFKKVSAEKGIYRAATSVLLASHDDGTMLRFLRARQFNVEGAFKQFSDTEAWRAANGIDSLYNTVDTEEYEEARVVYPQWTGGRDKRGIPVYVFPIQGIKGDALKAYNKPLSSVAVPPTATSVPRLLKLFALYENMTQFVLPLCTAVKNRPNPETPVTETNNIVDVTGVGLKQFWNLKSHMQDASTLATAHYPETLDRIFIIGAPSFFPTVWSWIKRWFDPVTTSKIFILGENEVAKTLLEFVDAEKLPKKYGGKLDWDWGMHPILDKETREIASEMYQGGEWVHGPVRWVQEEGKGKVVAVGSKGGKRREEVKAVIETADVGKGVHVAAVNGTEPVLESPSMANGVVKEVAA